MERARRSSTVTGKIAARVGRTWVEESTVENVGGRDRTVEMKGGWERGAASSDEKEGRIGRCRRRKGGSGRSTWHRGGSKGDPNAVPRVVCPTDGSGAETAPTCEVNHRNISSTQIQSVQAALSG